MKSTQRKSPKQKYNDTVPMWVYIHAKSGLPDDQIAKALNIERQTFYKWRNKEAVKAALQEARKGNSENGNSETFQEYVYKRLPPALARLWDKITFWADHDNGTEKIEAMLSHESIRVRQSLFMHAMVQSNFNASEACRKVNISRRTLDNWVESDPDFPKLLDEIKWHRNNMFEGTLIKLVKSGNVLATMFANRTQNRDRGYAEKLKIEGSFTHTHLHNHVVSIDRLELPIEERKKLLVRVRELKPVEETAVVPMTVEDDEEELAASRS